MRNAPPAPVERATSLAALRTACGRDLAEVQLYAMLTDASMLERVKFASTFTVTMNSGPSSRILFYAPCYVLATEIWEPAPTHPGKLRPILCAIGCAQRDVHTHRLALAALGAFLWTTWSAIGNGGNVGGMGSNGIEGIGTVDALFIGDVEFDDIARESRLSV